MCHQDRYDADGPHPTCADQVAFSVAFFAEKLNEKILPRMNSCRCSSLGVNTRYMSLGIIAKKKYRERLDEKTGGVSLFSRESSQVPTLHTNTK